MIRKIVKIDESKCTGCGQCVTACAEGALKIINGKARLVSDTYCDGLGACLGECPEGAITIEEREAREFDVALAHVASHAGAAQATVHAAPFACPGSRMMEMPRRAPAPKARADAASSELAHWPVQLALVPANAPFFRNADVLLVGDCVPFAFADFHARFLRGKAVVVGCPKLDDPALYADKLAEILRLGAVRSLTVVHMEVPCCRGLHRIAEKALAASKADTRLAEITVGIDGAVKDER